MADDAGAAKAGVAEAAISDAGVDGVAETAIADDAGVAEAANSGVSEDDDEDERDSDANDDDLPIMLEVVKMLVGLVLASTTKYGRPRCDHLSSIPFCPSSTVSRTPALWMAANV